jgi:hypothetical protein
MNQDPFSMPDLTAAILARTSGPACGRFHDLACDLADDLLTGDDLALAEGHLAHCPACRALVSSLREAALVLPAFAQAAPGEAFTASVLAQTRRLCLVQPPDRLVEGWTRFLRRPRAALESAYLATAAGLILTQIPLPGALDGVGTALLSRVRAESRASFTGSAPRPQPGATHLQLDRPVRLLRPPPPTLHRTFTRLSNTFKRAWSICSRALHGTAERLGFRQPAPSRTEPSDPSRRPAS